MKRKRIVSLLMTAVMVWSFAAVPAEAASPQQPEDSGKAVVVRYIPELEYRENMTEEERSEKAHTIYWTMGITPPKMPYQLEGGTVLPAEDADFKLINTEGSIVEAGNTEKTFSEYYVSPYLPGGHWYDATKSVFDADESKVDGIDDSYMCYAAAASNAIQWWMDVNRDLITDYAPLVRAGTLTQKEGLAAPEELLNLFAPTDRTPEELMQVAQNPVYRHERRALSRLWDDGGYVNLVMDSFFNGYIYDRKGPIQHRPDSPFAADPMGGFFSPAFGKKILSGREDVDHLTYEKANQNLKKYLDAGLGITIGYFISAMNAAHAVNLWGAEYDEQGNLCAVFLTDSNDGSLKFGAKGSRDWQRASMLRYEVLQDRSRWMITTQKEKKGGSNIQEMVLLTPASAELQWVIEHQRPYETDSPAIFPEGMIGPDPDHVHDLVYSASGNVLKQSCRESGCSYEGSIAMYLQDNVSRVYTGRPIKPCGLRVDVWQGPLPSIDQIRYENHTEAGMATARLTFGGATAEMNFTIEQAERSRPAAPQLLSRTATSVSLIPVEGALYRCGSGDWQESHTFGGLTAGAEYGFEVKIAESRNYKESPVSGTARISTLESGEEHAEYVIAFDPDGGTVTPEMAATKNKVLPTRPVPVKTGFRFNGWYTDRNGQGTMVISGDLTGEPTSFDRDTTVYAFWTANDYTLTLEYGNGQGGRQVLTKPYGAAISAREILEPTREGYVFDGWETAIPETMPAENRVIRACWKAADEDPHALRGTVTVEGEPRYPETLTASYTGNGSSVVYRWYRETDGGRQLLADGTRTYRLTREDIGSRITVSVTDGGDLTGEVTATTEAVAKQVGPVLGAVDGKYTLDYRQETAAAHEGYELVGVPAGGKVVPGSEIAIRIPGTAFREASNEVAICIPDRPGQPVGVRADQDGTVTGVTSDMEYRIGSGSWTDGTGAALKAAPGEVLFVRLKATDSAFAGLEKKIAIKGPDSGSGGSGGGGGGAGGGSAEQEDAVQNPDGSVTTTEKATDGSVKEVTRHRNGIVTTVVTDPRGSASTTAELSGQAIREAAGKQLGIQLPVKPTEMGTSIRIRTKTPAKITVPVRNPTAGTVAVIVHPDGREEVVRKSQIHGEGVTLEILGDTTVRIEDRGQTFRDVPQQYWADHEIRFVTARGLYQGTGEGRFSPDRGMTRGMLAQVLYHLENDPEAGFDGGFTDVSQDLWCREAIHWAAGQNIVSGYADGSFRDRQLITREQLAVMLHRYAGTPAAAGKALTFKDAASVSPFAEEAVAWAVENGILNGTSAGTLVPQGTATRAQVAAMLTRFLSR